MPFDPPYFPHSTQIALGYHLSILMAFIFLLSLFTPTASLHRLGALLCSVTGATDTNPSFFLSCFLPPPSQGPAFPPATTPKGDLTSPGPQNGYVTSDLPRHISLVWLPALAILLGSHTGHGRCHPRCHMFSLSSYLCGSSLYLKSFLNC